MLEEGTRSDFLVASCPPPPSCTDDSDASSSSRSPVPSPADLEVLTHHSNLPLLPLRDPAFLLSPLSPSIQAKMSTTATPEHAASSTLSKTKSNLRYLVNPASGSAPNSLVTRSSLKTFRYVLKFAFYRIMRYAVSPSSYYITSRFSEPHTRSRIFAWLLRRNMRSSQRELRH